MRVLLLSVFLLSGCSALDPDNEIRVTEYGGEGGVILYGSGTAGGCRVVQTGTVGGCMTYSGEKCSYASADCADVPVAE